ncbi:inactive phospholipase D5-like [Leptonychotes weddellii]|uniref:Inactive phospholipase D5-like n=1 Tax=Leptonychotes weddellii TaxID=9713 RepID=A0A7F8RWP4_LEPWE|nr:inactive phospholipase D5-like [Leptonychotes weddellii]
MEIRQHEWLSASPHEGFEQMRLKSRPKEPSPSLTRVGANFYSSVKQQDYSASVWLRRKDKLEHSQDRPLRFQIPLENSVGNFSAPAHLSQENIVKQNQEKKGEKRRTWPAIGDKLFG